MSASSLAIYPRKCWGTMVRTIPGTTIEIPAALKSLPTSQRGEHGEYGG